MKSDINTATLLLLLIVGALVAWHPAEAYSVVKGLAGSAYGLAVGLVRAVSGLTPF
jgi:hypothetical protein